MTVTINDTEIVRWTTASITTRYNALVSSFSITVEFDINNSEQRSLYKPLSYHTIKISDNGERILTGVILSHSFSNSANPELLTLSGYSLTGVLGDCTIPPDAFVQFKNNTLKTITEQLIKPFGLGLIVDPIVSEIVNTKYEYTAAEETETIQSYLDKLATQRNVLLSHDAYGNVLYTKVKAGSEKVNTTNLLFNKPTPITPEVSGAPEYAAQENTTTEREYISVFTFNGGMPATNYSLEVNGQQFHSEISVQGQQAADGSGQNSEASITNPYVPVYRPFVKKLTSGSQSQTTLSARNVLGSEVSNIKLSIDLSTWYLNGKLVKTNSIVVVNRPELYIYNDTKFFIESVNYKIDKTGRTATINCVLPETYTKDNVTNVFG